MKTSKPIATISYNTMDFLDNLLPMLVEEGIVYEYYYIPHIGEYGDKDHIHLFINLVKSIDTNDLRGRFTEPNELWYEKDLGCMPFVKSDFDNWLLYSLHDETYLMLKKEVKFEHYTIDDISSNTEYNLGNCYRDAFNKICNTDDISILDKLHSGYSPTQLIREGYNPQRIGQIYHLCQSEGLYIDTIRQQNCNNEILKADVSKLIAENHTLKKNEEFVNTFLTTFCKCDTYNISDINKLSKEDNNND